jgi:Arylsulfotransferase (ASST)
MIVVRRACSSRGFRAAAAALIALLVALLVLAAGSAGGSRAAGPAVSVFPIAGSRLGPPGTQITFRGVPANQLGKITVTGSVSGSHTGKVLSDSDGRGGSFMPDKPFTPGERVTVSTGLNIVGGQSGVFHFTVATPTRHRLNRGDLLAARTPRDVLRFHSRPDLMPVAVHVTKRPSHTAHGDIFISPWRGPLQNGPMVLDPHGRLIWFKPLPPRIFVSDFRVQTLNDKPVLTWWQGYFGTLYGTGEDVIYDTAYHQLATVKAGNGLSADLHEFELTPQGTALIAADEPVVWDASQIHRSTHAVVFDSVVQEIDIKTGLVLFQWDSLDHVPLADSYAKFSPTRTPYDFFHLNSIEQDDDGNLLIGGRSVSALYKVNRSTGAVMWQLGGRRSSFKFGVNASFAFAHDPRVQATNDATFSTFDNGTGDKIAGLYNVHRQSRALWLNLNFKTMTATHAREIDHSPSLRAVYAGSVQQLYNGDTFVGWGQQPYFSEYNSKGRLLFEARFADSNVSYRTYRFDWNGYPKTRPAVAASDSGKTTTVYVSWNGATGVKRWRVLAGASARSLTAATTAPRAGFETAIKIYRQSHVRVQALDGSGHVLGTSAVTASR